MIKVVDFEYPSSAEHFRALMENYILSNNHLWRAPNGEVLRIDYNHPIHLRTREAWIIRVIESDNDERVQEKPRASVLAMETYPGKTTVSFFDGVRFNVSSYRKEANPSNAAMDEWEENSIGPSILMSLANEIKTLWIRQERNAPADPIDEIPNIGWHRKAVRLWNDDYTAAQISTLLGGSPSEGRVWNVISELRKQYPHIVKRKKR